MSTSAKPFSDAPENRRGSIEVMAFATHAPYTVRPAIAVRPIEVVTMADVTPIIFVVDDASQCANRWSY
jgi:hypothetical protein